MSGKTVQIWPASAQRAKLDPFKSIDAKVFAKAEGLTLALIDACGRCDGEQLTGLVQPLTYKHGSHGTFVIAHEVMQAIATMNRWQAQADAARARGDVSQVESVVLPDCPVIFSPEPDDREGRLDLAADFLGWHLTGRHDLAWGWLRQRPLDAREVLEGLFEVTAGALAASAAQPVQVFAEDGATAIGEAIDAGKLYFVHTARFGDVSAVVDCVQALIVAFVRDGAGLSVDPVGDGYVVRLARRVVKGELLHQPVREIVEGHGGVYGWRIPDGLKLTPPMPPGYGQGAIELKEDRQ